MPGPTRAIPTKTYKILVADDEPAVSKMLKFILEREGHEVTAVANGEEALDALRVGTFDCLVTDAIMPVLSGFDLTRAVRKDPRDGQIPILMLTRKRHRLDVRQAVDAGVTDYVLKPVDENLLLDKIEICLKKAAARRQVFENASLQAAADLALRSEITALSESGLTMLVPALLPADLTCESRSQIFEEIGIRAPLMKLVSCEALPERRKTFGHEARFNFIGVLEADLMKIRSWLQKEAVRRRK
jgi:CheY-like chemotaxis protein